MNRRGFMGAILAAGAAPWIAKAGVLMPVRTLAVPGLIVPDVTPTYHRWINAKGEGAHDITLSLSEYDELYRRVPPLTRFREFCVK